MAIKAPYELMNASVPISDFVDQRLLNTDTAESYTVPARAKYALISADHPIAVRVGGTAVWPAADISDGTGSQYIPSTIQCKVESGRAISMIRAAGQATFVTIGLYD
jgi:hypothetical protein